MSGSDQRLWHKERKAWQKATGDRSIESVKDLDRYARTNGKILKRPDENVIAKPGPDITDTEARNMVDEFREEQYGRLPDGESIKELHGDRVLVEMLEEELSTILHIPDKVKGRPKRGIVRLTGPGKVSRDGSKVVPLEVKPGDRVVLLEFSGIDVGNDKRLVEEDEILAVVR